MWPSKGLSSDRYKESAAPQKGDNKHRGKVICQLDILSSHLHDRPPTTL